jgi:hypothetical protein
MQNREKQKNLVRGCITRGQYRNEFDFDQADAVLGLCYAEMPDDAWNDLVDDVKLVCEMDEREAVTAKDKMEAKERIIRLTQAYAKA